MLIRSQNKKSLSPIEIYSIGTANNGDSVRILADGQQSVVMLGEYSTEEKAIKVLDMIQEMYKRYACRYGSDCSKDAVFEMPLYGDL